MKAITWKIPEKTHEKNADHQRKMSRNVERAPSNEIAVGEFINLIKVFFGIQK